MNWFSKHVDTTIVLGAIISSSLWINGKFNKVEGRFNILEQEIVVIKTAMIMKGIMPDALAEKGEVK